MTIDYRTIEARILLNQARGLISDLDDHEGVEGWPADLRERIDLFSKASENWLKNTDRPAQPPTGDDRPTNCRNRLRDEGKAYPRSGCASCRTGGLLGCPYEIDPR